MDLRQLRYFVAIAEHGSLTRAAEQLRVAQPALSHHLRRLEEELGSQLLLRTTRGVAVTETGQRLLERARGLLQQVEAMREEIRGAEAVPAGPVTIGIPTSLGTVLSVPLALAVRRQLPQVRLRVVEGLSGHTLQWLRNGQVDLALVFGAAGVPGLKAQPVATEDLHLVTPAGDPILPRLKDSYGTVPFTALGGLPLILPGRPHGVREEVEDTAQANGVDLDVVLEMDALEHIKALVADGAGYTVLSARVARGGAWAGRLATAPITAPAITRSIHLAHPAERPLSIAAKAVHGLLTDMLSGLVSGGVWRSTT